MTDRRRGSFSMAVQLPACHMALTMTSSSFVIRSKRDPARQGTLALQKNSLLSFESFHSLVLGRLS